jgi:hypothetical protein
LGSLSGLVRFDGVRFQHYDPLQGDALSSRDVSALRATPDGGLWIGFRTGGASFVKDGRARGYGEKDGFPSATVRDIVLDHQGTVWVAASHGLFRFVDSHWEKIGHEWGFSAEAAVSLFLDDHGKLWVNGNTDLFCLPPGAHVFQMRKLPSTWTIRQTPDGRLWLAEYERGIRGVQVESLNRRQLHFAGEGVYALSNSKGEFSIPDLSADDYELVAVKHLPPGFYVKALTQAGRDVTRDPIRPGDDLTVTLLSDGPSVSGQAVDKDNGQRMTRRSS